MSRLSICIVLIAALLAISTLSVAYAAPVSEGPSSAANEAVASSSDASPDAQSSTGRTNEPVSSVNPTDGPISETTREKGALAESALLPVSSMVAVGLAALLL